MTISAETLPLQREADHRIKNSLHLVCSLLDRDACSPVLSPDGSAVFARAIARVRAVAEVHALLSSRPDRATVDMHFYLGSFAAGLREMLGGAAENVRLYTCVKSVELPLSLALPLGLVTSELVMNAFKHAFPERRCGQIIVLFRKHCGRYRLSVLDDGVGVSTSGRIGVGLELVPAIGKNLGARIEVVQRKPGTLVRVSVSA